MFFFAISGKGLQILSLDSVLTAFEGEGIFISTRLAWEGASGFCGFIWGTISCSCFVSEARGTGDPPPLQEPCQEKILKFISHPILNDVQEEAKLQYIMYLIGHLIITSSKLLYNYIYRFLDTNELSADPCFVYLFSVLNDLENGKISDILKHLQHAVKSIAPSGISLQNSCVRRVTTVMHEPTGSSDNPVRFTAGLTVTIPVHATLENIQNADSIRLKVFKKYMYLQNESNSYSNMGWGSSAVLIDTFLT